MNNNTSPIPRPYFKTLHTHQQCLYINFVQDRKAGRSPGQGNIEISTQSSHEETHYLLDIVDVLANDIAEWWLEVIPLGQLLDLRQRPLSKVLLPEVNSLLRQNKSQRNSVPWTQKDTQSWILSYYTHIHDIVLHSKFNKLSFTWMRDTVILKFLLVLIWTKIIRLHENF